MIDLKVRCSICGKEESNKDVIEEASDIIRKYNLKSEHYLSLLNLMSGKCLDSDEHSFIFDESFLKQIEEIVVKHEENLKEAEVLRNEQRNLVKEKSELIIKIEELQSKQQFNEHRLHNIYENDQSLNKDVGESTGNDNINIWL